jgi:outer membrane protein OmpA-like peptidoglycan-associated protein
MPRHSTQNITQAHSTSLGVVALAAFVLLTSHVLFSQEPVQTSLKAYARSGWSIGALGGMGRLYHASTFEIIPTEPLCCQYERGESWSVWGGLVGEYELVPNTLALGARILYAQRPLELTGKFSSLLDGRPLEEFNGATYDILTRTYTYRSEAQFLVGDFGVRILPIAGVPLYVRLSGDASVPFGRLSAAQNARVLSPNGTVRENRDTIREASVPLRLPSFGVTGALGVEIPLERRLTLDFEAQYRYGIGSIRSDATDWRTNALQATLGLRWRFERSVDSPEKDIPNKQNDDSQKDSPPLVISAITGKPLELQETIVTQTFPLLPYIFFDSASIVVRNRYNPRIGVLATFDEKVLPKETMEIYYHLLHIVGKRMKANPNAILTITGTTDGKEWANTDQRQILAMQRARSVASFLTGFWGIPQSRIRLATRNTPALASSGRYTEGDEENRRVELSSNVSDLLTPVVHSQFLECTPLQEQQFVAVSLLNPQEAESYEGRLEARTGQLLPRSQRETRTYTKATDTLALTKGTGAPPERLPFALGRKFAAKLLQYGSTLDSLQCKLEVAQLNGSVIRGETSLPVKTSKNQYEISRLNLIVFDFDRDDMQATNEMLLRRFAQESVKPASQVRITGSTDRLGELKYNQELSESRSKAVQEVMRRVNPRIQFVSVRGTGASTLPFDNDTPEGRYYCRTVSIDVQTPRW